MLASSELSAADGTSLRLWKQSADDATEAVLLVHGATYGIRAMFAPVDTGDQQFWFDAVSEGGRAAFGVDIRGYGDSERPGALTTPATENPPVVRASQAARDVDVALDHVRERFDTVHLVGISWGTIVSGVLFSELAPSVDSLTLYAPIYRLPETAADRFNPGDPPAAFRDISKADARARWDEQVPEAVDPVAWRGGDGEADPLFEAMWRAARTSGQGVDDAEEPTIRAPNGTLLDLQAAASDNPVYEPSEIDVPTMVVRGSHDPTSVRSDALDVFDAVRAEHTEFLEIDGGTHFLHLEPRRQTLYDAVTSFHDRVV